MGIAEKNLVLLNTSEEQRRILKSAPELQTVTVKKIFPHTLLVTATKSIPIAQLVNQPNFLLLSSNGKIIKSTNSSTEGLIPIVYFQHLRAFESKPGTVITHIEIQKALEVMHNRSALPFPLKKITINQPGKIVLIFSDTPLTVTFGTKKDIAKILFILHNIITGLERKGVRPSSVNLEFDKPIITV